LPEAYHIPQRFFKTSTAVYPTIDYTGGSPEALNCRTINI